MLLVAGRAEAAVSFTRGSLALDPRNPNLLFFVGIELWAAKRPRESRDAFEAMSRISSRGNPRRAMLFYYTGEGPSAAVTNPYSAISAAAASGSADPEFVRRMAVEFLRYQHRYGDIESLLGDFPDDLAPAAVFEGVGYSALARLPVAELRGWVHVLQGNTIAAIDDGRALLYFVDHVKVTRWNDWQLQLLRAEGLLFVGDHTAAVAAVRSGAGLMPRTRNALSALYASYVAAGVMAWAGAQDDAVTVLDDLSRAVPGVGPAHIARDPVFTVPLAKNARFRKLIARLEAEIRSYKAMLD